MPSLGYHDRVLIAAERAIERGEAPPDPDCLQCKGLGGWRNPDGGERCGCADPVWESCSDKVEWQVDRDTYVGFRTMHSAQQAIKHTWNAMCRMREDGTLHAKIADMYWVERR